MNLDALYALRDRLNSSGIAGTGFIGEDFRLARAVEQAKPLAAASPAFERIYTLALSLLSSDCPDRCGTLLDALALLDAVLCTQGVTGVTGEILPLCPAGGGKIQNIPHSILSPLMEALEGTGGGRQAVIEEAHRLHPSIFRDFRVQQALVSALGDGYSEIADRVQEWLCEGDSSAVPLLKKDFDPTLKRGMARRVRIIDKLAGALENDFYLSVVQGGDKDVRAAAVLALRHEEKNQEILLQLLKTEKAGAVKQAAQCALGHMTSPQALAHWEKCLDSRPEETVRFLRLSTAPLISDRVAAQLDSGLTHILERGEKGDWVLPKPDYTKLGALLLLSLGKDTPAMCQVYRRAAKEREALRHIQPDPLEKGKKEHQVDTSLFAPRGMSGKGCLGDLFPTLLLDSLLLQKSPALLALAEELYGDWGPSWAAPAMATAFISWPADRSVYDAFSPFFQTGGPLEKLPDREGTRIRGELLGVLGLLQRGADGAFVLSNVLDQGQHSPFYQGGTNALPDYLSDQQVQVSYPLAGGFDSRWIPLLTQMRWSPDENIYLLRQASSYYRSWGHLDDLLEHLMDEGDPAGLKALGSYFYRRAITAKDNRRYYQTLITCGWKDFQGLVVKYAEKNGAEMWYIRRSLETLPMTPEQKAQEVEAIAKLVEEKKIRAKNWSQEQAQSWCTELRAAGAQ